MSSPSNVGRQPIPIDIDGLLGERVAGDMSRARVLDIFSIIQPVHRSERERELSLNESLQMVKGTFKNWGYYPCSAPTCKYLGN